MIKLINYLPYGVTRTREEYISKHCIHSMKRDDDHTYICMDGGYSLRVKETPEEILAMPDIEPTEKVIDWEQRRYEIAKAAMHGILSNEQEVEYSIKEAHYKDYELHTIPKALSQFAIACADALIKELKK